MRSGSRILPLCAAVTLWLGAAAQSHAATSVTLAFQGGVKGSLKDCGCPHNPLGGLAPRSVLLDDIRAEHPNLALIDAGNLMGAVTDAAKAQSAFLARETVALGYSVTGVGTNDLSYGTAFLKKIERETGLHFTCANLYDGDAPMFSPFEVIDAGGVRIGVICVHDADANLSAMGEDASVTLRDPVASLDAWLPKLHAQSDVVVLLSHLRPTYLESLLRAVDADQRIDFVIDGVGQAHPLHARRMGSSLYVAANDQGKYLGELNFTLEDDGSIDAVDYVLHEVHPKPADDAVAARVAAFEKQQQSLAEAEPIHQ